MDLEGYGSDSEAGDDSGFESDDRDDIRMDDIDGMLNDPTASKGLSSTETKADRPGDAETSDSDDENALNNNNGTKRRRLNTSSSILSPSNSITSSLGISAAPPVEDDNGVSGIGAMDLWRGGVGTQGVLSSSATTSMQPRAAGVAERIYLDERAFRENRHLFDQRGLAADPMGSGKFVFDPRRQGTDVAKKAVELTGLGLSDAMVALSSIERQKRKRREKESSSYDAGDVDGYKGPWARYADEAEKAAKPQELTEEQKKFAQALKQKKEKEAEESKLPEEKFTFYGRELVNTLGRSFRLPPADFRPKDHACYIPKQRIHVWAPESKGISSIRFYPVSGHLLLSAGLDGVVRLYDVQTDRRLMATYSGHAAAVREVEWMDNGARFVTGSYDGYIKVWDTETGQVVTRMTKKGTNPLCVTPHPVKKDELLSGMRDRTICQWDLRTSDIVQTYTDHMGAVNTVTFLDPEGETFITSSDDKKLLVWDYGINVVIKYIAEPDLHSIPSIAMHPSGKYFVGNAQDNQALVFACDGRVKLNRRKRFAGHSTAGFACGLTFSPDGQFLCSGDAEGRLFFWDFKTGKTLRRIKAHNQVSIGVQWHPQEPSRVASCSWDGTIKYWD